MENFYGDPYINCRPQCILNSDCDNSKACINNKCVDVCLGICGMNARCEVVNHSPTCYCIENFVGNPYQKCSRKPDCKKILGYSFLKKKC